MNEASVRLDQEEFLKRLKARPGKEHVLVENIDIVAAPGVFPPTTDTRLLAKHIKTSSKHRVLDITCGSGVFSVIAGLQGAHGVANDLNPEAVVTARENIKHYNLDFIVTEGDMFTNVPEGKFDFIFSNGPYIEGVIKESLELAFFGAKKYAEDLFTGAKERLAPNGKMLITFAEFGDITFFEKVAKNNGFTGKVLDKSTSSDGQRIYRLYEFSTMNT
jgi:methylase of polypeptide subunit release factors